MVRLLKVVVVAAAMFGMANAAPVRDAIEEEFFYPTQSGAKWVTEGEGSEVTTSVERVERRKDGTLVVSVVVLPNGKQARVSYKYLVSREGVFELQVNEEKYPQPECMFKADARPGDSWEASGGTHTRGKPEQVKVPAGVFTAVPVHYKLKSPFGLESAGTVWHAKGVGVVKSVHEVKGTNMREVHVLKSFTPGKP